MSDAPAAHRQNRLAAETSPYLLQHASNPVDWYPWGEEAFAEARRTDRPILLSVGYSSCHWCHVMAHESFENEAIAAQMNRWFINIKVDREERPDIDDVYMTVTQALTGQGGWPMTVFLTPDREPFFAGTYFPPEDAHGRPGFPRVLERIHETWLHDRERVLTSAQTITERLRVASERGAQGDGVIAAPQAAGAVAWFREHADATWGGFGGAPKFPAPANLDFLLLHYTRVGTDEAEPSALALVVDTLRAMADGGIYDHLGGGFHRYSVDAQWLVPHFEKMLYDNAQLVITYLHAWQLTHEPRFEQVIRETLDYLLREMCDAEGGFYAATDADSEGIEGKYFVWTPDEVRAVLSEEDGALFNRAYGVTPDGNFMDPHHVEFGRRTVLHRPVPIGTLAAERGVPTEALEAHLTTLRERLRLMREQRVAPALDDKVLTAWNGLALTACAEAGRVLDEPRYLEAARANAAFVRRALWHDGRLLHTYRAGIAKVAGLVEDYAQYGLGLIALYRATGDVSHLAWATELLDVLLTHFHDAAGGGFFDAPHDGESLLLRQKPVFDAAVPSGNAAAAQLAYWLGRYYNRTDCEAVAHEVLALTQEHMQLAPSGFGALWQVAELLLAPRREIAIVGDADARRPFARALAQQFLPAVVIAPGLPDGGLPLLAERGRDRAAAYVCENMACALPALDVDTLRAQLEAIVGHGRVTAVTRP